MGKAKYIVRKSNLTIGKDWKEVGEYEDLEEAIAFVEKNINVTYREDTGHMMIKITVFVVSR